MNISSMNRQQLNQFQRLLASNRKQKLSVCVPLKADGNGWRIGPDAEKQYRKSLQAVLQEQKYWDIFKKDNFLRSVWGEPAVMQAFQMYQELKGVPEVFSKFPDMAKMDAVGGAVVYPVENALYGPNLLRFADSVRLVHKYVGSLDGLKVLEFGSGYGGLAFCSHQVWKPASWHIIDLQEAMDVAVRHCDQLGVKVSPAVDGEAYDLFIAEFSLTEMVGNALWEATDKYIMTSPRIFIRCNIIDDAVREKWILKLREEFDLTILREVGDSVRFNSIVVGKK